MVSSAGNRPTAPPLVVRCGAMGDMVMLTSLMRLVAARHGSKVDVVSSGGWTAPVMAHEPTLGHLQLVTSRKTPYLFCPSQWELVRWLRGRGRGPVYLCDPDPEIRRLLLRGGVREEDLVERTGEELATPMLWPDRWMLFGLRDPARRYAVAEADPAPFRLPRLVVPDASREALARWLESEALAGPLVLFQPGNKRTHKRGKVMTADHPKHWEPEHWAAVARAVLDELPGARVLLCGSPPEHPVLEDVRAAAGDEPRIRNLANDLPIPRLFALLERAHSMVSVDTGPAHAAAALGCPLVVLFGAAPPALWRPVGSGPIAVLGGERGADSRVADIAPQAVIEAWKSLPPRG
ncbi:glycosyltransferase family 9 protein [Luteimonas sp. RD2P54]|uniref:Glycosyltransferase family 9 protein n=1 Tax=Luteimonas endophytica TaxID=3042023 RepID=A0ABT6J5R3_9GAMM|nr:glycosyltransferase family 9 protein [Luteimonas endophytica]MDH5821930.1 glycosyltransferase family 9 protein [Luteimonas endophytica]